MSEARFYTPGFWTLAVHLVVIALLTVVVATLWPFRVLSSYAAEALIRLSDATCDALTERLGR